jgi:uncharacterized membrane protein
MSGLRREVMEWLGDGRAAPGRERDLLRAAGIAPSRADWRAFLSLLTLWLGVAALAAAIIFFFAFNWDALSRFAKFGLVEGAILAALIACWRLDLDAPAGKAVLVLLSLLAGALLALTGQVYQTGADAWELFAWWALLILPWVAVSRFSPHWLLWLAIADLALFFYSYAGLFRDTDALFWSLLAFNAAALAGWEAAHRAGIAWLRDDWPPRLVSVPAAIAATGLGLSAVLDDGHWMGLFGFLLWIACVAAWYRLVRLDLFMLAGAILSAIIVVAGFMIRHLLGEGAPGYLMVGLLIAGMAGGGATWLRAIGREART